MRTIAALLLCLCLLAIASSAQTKTGTTVGQFLLIEPSARITGMGNAGVAISDEALAFYYNPASLGLLGNSDVQFTHSNWLAGITYDYLGAAVNLGTAGNLGLSVTLLNSGEMAVRTVEQPAGTGERYTVSDFAIGLGYGNHITDRFSVGFQISYIQETIWHSSLSAFSMNFGTLYKISSDGLQLGASISNFGTRGKYNGRDLRIRYDFDPTRNGDNSALPGEILTDEFSLPVVFRVGCSYPIEINSENSVRFAVDAFHPSDNSESMSFGTEYLFMKSFALRAGYQHLFQTDSQIGLTLGAGFTYDVYQYVLHIDYAWAKHDRLGDMQRMTFGITY